MPLVALQTRQGRSLFIQTKYCQNLLRNAGEPHQQVFHRLRCRRKRSSNITSAVRQRYADQGVVLMNILFTQHLPRLSLLRDDRDDRCKFFHCRIICEEFMATPRLSVNIGTCMAQHNTSTHMETRTRKDMWGQCTWRMLCSLVLNRPRPVTRSTKQASAGEPGKRGFDFLGCIRPLGFQLLAVRKREVKSLRSKVMEHKTDQTWMKC